MSFLAHFVPASAVLILLRRTSAIAFPTEFTTTPLSGTLLAGRDDAALLGLSDIAVALLLGATMGLTIVTLALVLRQRRSSTKDSYFLGEVNRFMPTSRDQRVWWAVLSLNAGVSEELYYRLLLPLLLTPLIANTLVAFTIGAAVFGIAHFYQGVRGVILTFLVGLLLGAFYLATENLILVMVVHVLIDLRLVLLRRSPSPGQAPHS